MSARSWAPATSPVRTRRSLGLCVVVTLLLSACATRVVPIGAGPGPFTPDADERLLWAQADKDATALLARVRLHDDAVLVTYLTGLAERLTPAAARTAGGPAPRVILLRDPTLGAFAWPDGRVFVHTGLVAAVESEAQLALVLARELAHVIQRHALVAWRDGRVGPPLVTEAGPLAPTAAAIRAGKLPVATLAAVTGYGERLERAADEAGLAAVAGAGWDARAAAAVWPTLAGQAGERGALETLLLGRPAWLRDRIEGTAGGGPAAEAATPDGVFEARRRALVRDNAGDDTRRGRFALARRQLDRVLAADPGDAAAVVADGELYRLRSQRAATPEERDAEIRLARARYTRALALDPARVEAHRQLGLLYFQQQSFARAREALQAYLAGAPGAADAARIAEYVRELGR